MKVYSSELAHNYNSYTFGYAIYGELEKDDRLESLYNMGFLPYTGSPEAPHTLYMARSMRVPLSLFTLSSENRRIAKKFDDQFTKQRVPMARFNPDENFFSFCLDYFAGKHGARAMPRERLQFILKSPFITDMVLYRQKEKLVACVFEIRDGGAGHYWFSFYDLSMARQSLGLWLMLDGVRDAQTAGFKHYYLGTVYGEKALYKTNFEPLEWWDGQDWQSDSDLLRERGRTDNTRIVELMDAWKQNKRLF